MKNPPSPLKYGIISGIAFFGTVAVLSLVYATIGSNWISPGTLEVGAGSGLTASSWNAMLADFNNLDARSVPTGAVMAFNGPSCPNGWSAADGSGDEKNTTWTNTTLDLRGEFIRGVDGGRGVDIGRVLGSAQSGTNHPNIAVYASSVVGWILVSPSLNAYGGIYPNHNQPDGTSDSIDAVTATTYMSVWLTPTGWTITGKYFRSHPRNVALLYCVKN